MDRRKIHYLPENAERAMGCWDEATAVRYVAIYRDVNEEGRWYSGMAQGYLLPELLGLLEKLWGVLVRGYAFVLDVETRVVTLHSLLTLESDFLVAQIASPRLWLQDDQVVKAVVARLIAYLEDPRAVEEPGCIECFSGYLWADLLYAFVPCPWCEGNG